MRGSLKRSRVAVASGIGFIFLVQACSALPGQTDTAANPNSAEPVQTSSPTSPTQGEEDAQLAIPEADIPDPEPRSPFQPVALARGEKPPQFVVISVDGACEMRSGVMSDLLDLGQETGSRFTHFVSGLCILPESKKMAYHPPNKSRGTSDIGFGDADMIAKRLKVFTRTYEEGHEISTHFLGHFCGATGVDSWSNAQWRSEIQQAKKFLDNWPRFNPKVNVEPLPFDSTIWAGARTPCLAGKRSQMLPAFAAEGLRYDASDPGELKWPIKAAGGKLWEFPLPMLKISNSNTRALAMDYNFMVVLNNSRSSVDAATCARIEKQTRDTYMNALQATNRSTRAPLFIGLHMNPWLCNAFVTSLHDFVQAANTKYPKVQFITFAELVDWLEVQDPKVLKKLQKKPPVTSY